MPCNHKLLQLTEKTYGALQKPLTTVTSETGQQVTPISCYWNMLYHPLFTERKQWEIKCKKKPDISKIDPDMKVKVE